MRILVMQDLSSLPGLKYGRKYLGQKSVGVCVLHAGRSGMRDIVDNPRMIGIVEGSGDRPTNKNTYPPKECQHHLPLV